MLLKENLGTKHAEPIAENGGSLPYVDAIWRGIDGFASTFGVA